jgi:hypothetical protein
MIGQGRVVPLSRRSSLDEAAATEAPRPQSPFSSQLNLLRDAERIVNLDPETPDGTFELRVTKQQLSPSGESSANLIFGDESRQRLSCRVPPGEARLLCVNDSAR